MSHRIEGFRRSLSVRKRVYWDLRLGLAGKIRIDTETRAILAEFATDEDDQLRCLAGDALERLKVDSLTHYAWAILKLGKDLSPTMATIETVARLIHDTDPNVAEAVINWLENVPNSHRENDVLYDTLIDADDRQSMAWLIESGRIPSQPTSHLLAILLSDGDVDPFLESKSLGTIFATAWARANQDQRSALLDAVESRSDQRLVDAYEEALGARQDFDLDWFVRALMTVDADDRLYALLPQLTFVQGLGILARWDQSDWLPSREGDRAFVHELVEHYRSLNTGQDDLPEEEETSWFQRYATAMNRTVTSSDGNGIIWVNMAAGAVPELLAAPLSGDPDEFEDYLATKNMLDAHTGDLPTRLSSLLTLLIRFRKQHATTIQVFEVES